MRGAPHNGFASAIVRINWRTSRGTLGRPTRRRLFHVQKSRKPRRCQARTVSGLTMTTAARHSFQTSRQPDPQHSVGMREPQSLRPRSVHHVELMSQRQDLKLQGSPIAERHAEGQEQRDDDGSHRRRPYPRKAARSMFARGTELLAGTALPSCRVQRRDVWATSSVPSGRSTSVSVLLRSGIRDARRRRRKRRIPTGSSHPILAHSRFPQTRTPTAAEWRRPARCEGAR